MTPFQTLAPSPRLRAAVAFAGPALLVAVLLLLLITISTGSTIGAGFAVAMAVGLCLVLAAGFEGAAIALFALGIALSPLDRLRPVAALGIASLSDLILFAALGLLIPVLMGRPFPREPLYLAGASGLFIVGIVSSVLSDNPVGSLAFLMRLAIGALLLPIVFSWWRPRREVLIAFAASYVAGNILNLGFAFTVGVVDFGRRLGYSTHPNIMGLAAMLGFALCPFLWTVLPKAYRWTALAGAAGCGLGVWVSGSRAALLALAAVIVLYVVFSRSVGVAVTLFGAAIPVAYFVAQAYLKGDDSSDNALGRLFGGGSAGGSDVAREQLAQEAWDSFQKHPVIGQGLAEILEAHNIYLQVAAGIGVIGLAVYLVMLGSVFLRAARLPDPYVLLVLPVMGYAIIGAMTTILWDRYVWTVLALPFLIPALSRPDPSSDDPEDRGELVGSGQRLDV
ncbi:hypothetical protein ASD11_00080 [Aeromicrobium sp. Root495]|uniref:O-antigen ligase family protein n=1 Tax=Aeromicrobium sp. Root495 TaxID=1736550 RepID=UPI0006FB82F6|nr:O-antigen ligase family protein [Aeromicrobium sp. Root495]KQY58111.1 hypothetical protein ASD11_00080 [Aeromicrobium sp. Root495]